MDSSLAKGGINDVSGRLMDDHLCLQRVLLFLATVISSLFFSRAAKLAGSISVPVEPGQSEETDEIAAVAPADVDDVAAETEGAALEEGKPPLNPEQRKPVVGWQVLRLVALTRG